MRSSLNSKLCVRVMLESRQFFPEYMSRMLMKYLPFWLTRNYTRNAIYSSRRSAVSFVPNKMGLTENNATTRKQCFKQHGFQTNPRKKKINKQNCIQTTPRDKIRYRLNGPAERKTKVIENEKKTMKQCTALTSRVFDSFVEVPNEKIWWESFWNCVFYWRCERSESTEPTVAKWKAYHK